MASKRIDLGDGKWAEVRPLTAGDLRTMRKAAYARGYGVDDDTLNNMFLITSLVTAWSFGPVDEATLDALPLKDLNRLLEEIKREDDGDPNASSSSSAGGEPIPTSADAVSWSGRSA